MATAFKPDRNRSGRWVVQDADAGTFKVSREAFTSQEVFERERDRIFHRCWLYLGHGSELSNPSDFVTRVVAGHELIFNRDRKGNFQALFNTCPHRGAMVERRKSGNAIAFKCFYHGWAFNNNGKFATRSGPGCYPDGFGNDGAVDLPRVPRLESHADFWFVNFDADAEPLANYLGDAKGALELIGDHSPHGMEIIGGTQDYSIRANWKLLAENSYDGYHAAETHSTYFTYLLDVVGEGALQALGELSKYGRVHDMKNGHAMIEGRAPWGRPVARAIPSWGEKGKADAAAKSAELEQRVGGERAERIADRDRNIVIFPNLVINDIMSLTVRTFYPLAPGRMHVSSWAMGPKGEADDMRKRRLDNFLEFLGPGGFATPDDIEALELAQVGYGNAAYAPWNDISRGMLRDKPLNDDEEQMRCYWREWSKRMEGEA